MIDIAAKIIDGEAVDIGFPKTLTDFNGVTQRSRDVIAKYSPEQIVVNFGVWVHKWPEVPDDRYLVSREMSVVNNRIIFTQTTESKDPALSNAEVFALLLENLRGNARAVIYQEVLKLTSERVSQPTPEQIDSFLDNLNASQMTNLQKATLGLPE